jgi:drug/metabolite transporter (DMT)-like permease
MNEARARRLAPYYLASSMALVGANVALGKMIVALVPVFAFLLLRGVVSCLCFTPEYLRHAREGVPLTRSQHKGLFVQAFLGMLGFSTFMLFGLKLTSATSAGVITGTLPAVVALLSWLVLRERLTQRVLLSVALAVAGVLILNLESYIYSKQDSSVNGNIIFGNILILCAVVCEASYVVASRHLAGSMSAARSSAIANWYGLLCFLPLGLWSLKDVPWAQIDAKLWLIMIWYVIAASVICFWLWMKGAVHVSANRAGVFTACLPIAAALTAIVVLGERVTLYHGIAFVLVVAGVWLAATDKPLPLPPA